MSCFAGRWYSEDFYGSHGRERQRVFSDSQGCVRAIKETGDPNIPEGFTTWRTLAPLSEGRKVNGCVQVRQDPGDPDGFEEMSVTIEAITTDHIRVSYGRGGHSGNFHRDGSLGGDWQSCDFYGPHGVERQRIQTDRHGCTEAIKITGDPNVPAGYMTWRSKSPLQPGKAVPGVVQIRSDTSDPNGFSLIPATITQFNADLIKVTIGSHTGNFVRQAAISFTGPFFSQDFYGPHGKERVRLVQSTRNTVTATKVTGDPNVPAGKVTWRTSGQLFPGVVVPGKLTVRSNPSDPNGFSELDIQVKALSWDHIQVFWRGTTGNFHREEGFLAGFCEVATEQAFANSNYCKHHPRTPASCAEAKQAFRRMCSVSQDMSLAIQGSAQTELLSMFDQDGDAMRLYTADTKTGIDKGKFGKFYKYLNCVLNNDTERLIAEAMPIFTRIENLIRMEAHPGGIVYKGSEEPRDHTWNALETALRYGGIIRFCQIQSASSDQIIAESFMPDEHPFLWIIEIPRGFRGGRQIEQFSNFNEKETCFCPYTAFKVRSFDQRGSPPRCNLVCVSEY
eukprot:TRINITY_DN89118_c0_g1_i1.p1 TRINITY_DN89118_c0_g1~~TRINITY_DN89118_c0_g1_i1.p1  ORF type:complete len:562 (+),score=55.27 TRINITY_DN89118_c0_g1_i1:50-1735(+)